MSRLGGARLGSHDARQPIRRGGNCQAISLDYWTESEGNQSASIRRAAAPASRLLALGAVRSGLGGTAGYGLQHMAVCHHFLPGLRHLDSKATGLSPCSPLCDGPGQLLGHGWGSLPIFSGLLQELRGEKGELSKKLPGCRITFGQTSQAPKFPCFASSLPACPWCLAGTDSGQNYPREDPPALAS